MDDYDGEDIFDMAKLEAMGGREVCGVVCVY